jgi:hypothetical protein
MELNRGELLAFQPVSPPAQGAQGRRGLRPMSHNCGCGELGSTVIWDLFVICHLGFVCYLSFGICSLFVIWDLFVICHLGFVISVSLLLLTLTHNYPRLVHEN